MSCAAPTAPKRARCPSTAERFSFCHERELLAGRSQALDRERLAHTKRQRAEQAREYFRANAAQWSRIRSLYIDEQEVEAALVALLPPEGLRDLLDIGTGTGRMLEIFGPRAERVLARVHRRLRVALARGDRPAAGRPG